ncbi:hypothetical protein HOA92_06045 [archaeon]|jgi:hypothetical protein|nr:hypothetical protein [archaeon]MBT6762572.1 hypothetical protein [archaeon]
MSLDQLTEAMPGLFLFPEYADRADEFSEYSLQNRDVKIDGSRGSRVVQSLNGNSYMVKPQRSNDDRFIKKFKDEERPDSIYRGDLILKELLITRILGQCATYEDELSYVEFEKPVGYRQRDDASKESIFEYSPPTDPVRVKNFENARIAAYYFFKEERNLAETIEAKFAALNRRNRNDWLTSELYTPFLFTEVLMLYNGVSHNEMPQDHLKRTNNNKNGVLAIDFELCDLAVRPALLERKIEHVLLDFVELGKGLSRTKRKRKHFNKPVVARREWLMEQFAEGTFSAIQDPLKKRFQEYLASSGFFEGRIHTFGPAYNQIKELNAEILS